MLKMSFPNSQLYYEHFKKNLSEWSRERKNRTIRNGDAGTLLHCHVTGRTYFLATPYYHPSPTIASHSFVLLFVLRLPTNSVRCLWVFESSALNTPPTVYTLSTIVQWRGCTVYELYYCVHTLTTIVQWNNTIIEQPLAYVQKNLDIKKLFLLY